MEKLTKIKVGVSGALTGKALTAGGAAFEACAADETMCFLVTAAAEDTITVKAGENVFAGADETFTVPAGTSILRAETGKHKKDGAVTICGKNTTTVTAIALE